MFDYREERLEEVENCRIQQLNCHQFPIGIGDLQNYFRWAFHVIGSCITESKSKVNTIPAIGTWSQYDSQPAIHCSCDRCKFIDDAFICTSIYIYIPNCYGGFWKQCLAGLSSGAGTTIALYHEWQRNFGATVGATHQNQGVTKSHPTIDGRNLLRI
jgi:hypothetical protein